jgi:hypothetical protein
MPSIALVSPSDILAERQRQADKGYLAHSARVGGEFSARQKCTCYNCRSYLDPTGEIDAAAVNAQIIETAHLKMYISKLEDIYTHLELDMEKLENERSNEEQAMFDRQWDYIDIQKKLVMDAIQTSQAKLTNLLQQYLVKNF